MSTAGYQQEAPGPARGARRDLKARVKSLVLMPVGTVTSRFDVPDLISMTFDDGPHPQVTPRLLKVLARRGAKATFFILTDHAAAHPQLVKQLVAEGHEVALHYDRHDRIPKLPPQIALARMRDAQKLLADIAERPITLFRPPYGSQNYRTYFMARSLGMQVVGWSQCANDWMDMSVEQSAHCVTDFLTGGDIVLQHDGLELEPHEVRPDLDRVDVADAILSDAANHGLRSVTVTELLGHGSARLAHWFR